MNERWLFRGKRIDTGEWVTGQLLENEETCILISEFKDTGKSMTLELGYDVVPETIGQCTGLRDKNGTMIYEGDIVEYGLLSRETKVRAVIAWDRYKWVMKGKYRDENIHIYACYPDLNWVAIVGNIYEGKMMK